MVVQKLYRVEDAIFDPYQSFSVRHLSGSFSNEFEVHWDGGVSGAVEYELEWVYVDTYDDFSGSSGVSAFAFKAGSGVITGSLSYRLRGYYPSGQLWFRVRALGMNPSYPSYLIPGQWQYGSSPAVVANHSLERAGIS